MKGPFKPLPEAPVSELDLRESGAAVSGSAALSVSSRAAAQGAARRREAARAAEHLPPADHLAQLRRWRAKASLLAQLAVRTELDREAPPAFFPPRDFFGQALAVYQRAWHLCRCFNIGGAELATLAAEIGFLLRVQGDACGALEMAAEAGHAELLGLCLRDLRRGGLPSGPGQRERTARALERVRGGGEEESEALELLRQAAAGGGEAGLSLARCLARLAAVEQDAARRETLLRQLRELAPLGPEVARLIGQCGDVVLLAARPGAPPDEPPLRVRASRLALSEVELQFFFFFFSFASSSHLLLLLVQASDYFAALLSGAFAEGRETEVRVETRYPAQLERAVHFLYVGDLEEPRNLSEAIELLACALELQVSRHRVSPLSVSTLCPFRCFRCPGWPRMRPSS